MTVNGAALELHGLAAAYGDGWALTDVDLAIPAGRLVGVIGPNGSGKSTLLRAILGLVPVRRGTVTLGGVPVEQQRRRIAYVPQRELVDWSFPISAAQVVLMGRYPRIGLVARRRAPPTTGRWRRRSSASAWRPSAIDRSARSRAGSSSASSSPAPWCRRHRSCSWTSR